jgi:hypothetical protein
MSAPLQTHSINPFVMSDFLSRIQVPGRTTPVGRRRDATRG